MHRKKRDIDIKVGDILTLEGGLGKTFLKGGLNLGAAYYAQWKVTPAKQPRRGFIISERGAREREVKDD